MFETVQLSNREKSFFPAHWSSEKVVENIIEASNNIEKVRQKTGSIELSGITNEGIEILIVVKQDGRFVTAYPVI